MVFFFIDFKLSYLQYKVTLFCFNMVVVNMFLWHFKHKKVLNNMFFKNIDLFLLRVIIFLLPLIS